MLATKQRSAWAQRGKQLTDGVTRLGMDRQLEARGTKERGPSLGWQMVRDEQKGSWRWRWRWRRCRRRCWLWRWRWQTQRSAAQLCTVQCGDVGCSVTAANRTTPCLVSPSWPPSVTAVDQAMALEMCEPTLGNHCSTQKPSMTKGFSMLLRRGVLSGAGSPWLHGHSSAVITPQKPESTLLV